MFVPNVYLYQFFLVECYGGLAILKVFELSLLEESSKEYLRKCGFSMINEEAYCTLAAKRGN